MYLSLHFSYFKRDGDEYVICNELTGQELVVGQDEFSRIERLLERFGVVSASVEKFEKTRLVDLGVLFESKANFQREFFNHFEKNRSKHPVVDQVELTNACSYGCIMCPRPKSMTRKVEFMSLRLFEAIVKSVHRHQRFLTLHHFGESLLHNDLHEAVRIAGAYGLHTGLSCNPASLTVEKSFQLHRAGLSSVTFTIDSLIDSRHQKIRGTKTTVRESIENICKFIAIGRKLSSRTLIALQMIQLNENQGEYEQLIEKAKELGVHSARVVCFGRWDFSDEKSKRLGDFSAFQGFKCSCPDRWKGCSILSNGNVVPCCRDYNGDIFLGKVNPNEEDSLGLIWDSQKYLRLRRNESRYKRCQNCWSSSFFKERKRIQIGYLDFHKKKIPIGNSYEWFEEGIRQEYAKIDFPVEFLNHRSDG